MKKVTNFNKLALFFLLAIAMSFSAQAQAPLIPLNYAFDSDSLSGFDENAAKNIAIQKGLFGDEYKVFMYREKRSYIIVKYQLPATDPFKEEAIFNSRPMHNPSPAQNGLQVNQRGGTGPVLTSASCNNEDFEASSPGTVSSITAVSGWSVYSGSHSSCVCSFPITGNPSASSVIYCNPATGYVDPTIGAQYPIYSVFGSPTTNSGNSVSLNSGLPTMYGSTVFRLNNNVANYSAERLSKQFVVSPSNALFQFSYISVFYTSHACCEAGAFNIKLTNVTAGTVIACPSYSVSAPSSQCTNSASPQYYNTGTTNPSSLSSSQIYNPWVFSSIDLTSYIGTTIQIDVIASDCCYGGHFGYVYFDAQCSPMDIIGNGTNFPAGTPNITLPTCGAGSTATITAPSGLAPYQWVGPAGFTPSTNQTIVTNITGNYTLTMNPPGSCVPIVKTVSVVISPAPNLVVSNIQQFTCAQPTVNAATIQMSSGTPGSGTPNYTVSWSPPPTTVVGSSATSYSVAGMSVGINTVTITDLVGCQATTTVNVAPPPPTPTFTLSAPSGTLVGCNPPSITLVAGNTSSLSNVTFTWTSIQTGTATGNTINGAVTSGTMNTYTVVAQDLSIPSCTLAQTIDIGANTALPGCTVNPISGTLTCGGGPITFTATSSSTTNILGAWYDISNPSLPLNSPSSTPLLYSAGSPGTFVATFTNIANGCISSQTVAVDANIIVPTMTINTPTGTKITCATPCLTLNISASPGPVPKTYVWTNLQTAISTTVPTGGYTVCTPGNYLAQYQDGNNCMIQQQITITIDTVKPAPTAITNLPSNSFTLNCYNPVLTATAITNPMLPVSSYSWVQPAPSLVVASHTMQVNTISVTANPTTFTVLAMGSNGCVGRSKVLFYEDLVTPVYKVVYTPTAITCSNPDVALSLQFVSGPSTASNFTITSPPPTTTANASGTLFNIPGVYTATVMLASNGCTAAAQSATVPLNTTPPATVATPANISIPCGSPTVNISAGTLTTSTSYSYAWSGPPGSGISSPNKNTTSVNMPGEYAVVITNTVNGCVAFNVVDVTTGSLSISFTADPMTGYAPLPVNFANTSTLGAQTGTAVVMTSWSYGNGSASTSTATSSNSSSLVNGSTTYSAAGVYTVQLYMTQSFGTSSCVGTASAVITVDLPSNLTIPNVFTPNNDGVNDKFMVNSTNLTEITCIIFDRWGVKMYDVTSSTGNISWDGKNLSGKEVPVGTYFYIITAKGKDEIPYEQKGTVSLYR